MCQFPPAKETTNPPTTLRFFGLATVVLIVFVREDGDELRDVAGRLALAVHIPDELALIDRLLHGVGVVVNGHNDLLAEVGFDVGGADVLPLACAVHDEAHAIGLDAKRRERFEASEGVANSDDVGSGDEHHHVRHLQREVGRRGHHAAAVDEDVHIRLRCDADDVVDVVLGVVGDLADVVRLREHVRLALVHDDGAGEHALV